MKVDLILSMVIITITLYVYFFSSMPARWIAKMLVAQKSLDQVTWPIYMRRILGFICLGSASLVTMVIYGDKMDEFSGLGFLAEIKIWLIVIGITIITQIINYFNASSQSNLALYPQIRKEEWSFSLLACSGFTWVIYLCAYEFLLRGVLLFSTLSILDQTATIVLNVAIYAFIHLPKGTKETLASIPFGIVMCILTLASQSIWPAVFLHIVLALSNEWFSLYYHPDMSVK